MVQQIFLIPTVLLKLAVSAVQDQGSLSAYTSVKVFRSLCQVEGSLQFQEEQDVAIKQFCSIRIIQ